MSVTARPAARAKIRVVWSRDAAPTPATEAAIVSAIEKDLRAARIQRRFDDMLHHLDELFIFHKHAESAAVRSRCAALLAGA
ncbi:hypothetical protein [Rhodopseudomonas pseudopalustris]|uniref:Uncharacterized protein n=1 Tax=Rhodopseudomonas pseudopalustris TaxID=1513892 RepID=A0A1H8LSD6_9BRAD|nr:hypothetical protein [Rhodopseudomonas pseudopalustris]SEO08010.1 hypothetical protein SAMN05444123_101201 [Rhodopseudomonas pseudopalustris]